MDITKISFDETKYGTTFDQLDVNGDGVINETDLTNATDDTVKATLTQVLADANTDEDSEIEKEETNANTNNTTSGTKTAEDVAQAAKDLLEKYPVSGSGSGYTMSNPELAAFKKAMDDGIVSSLAQEGFSKNDIVDIINQAFPTIGIQNNEKGGYTCPNGQDTDAKALYDKFVEELSSVTSTNVKALEAEIKTLNAEIGSNNLRLNKLKGSIEILQAAVEEAITEAIKESEEIEESQKEDAANIVKEELNKYTESNGEITYEDFQDTVAVKLDDLQGDGSNKLSKVVLKLMTAESQMGVLKNYVTEFGTLVDANKTLADKVTAKTAEAEEAAEEVDCEAQRCDPIGFVANGVQYDFFVDNDGNGDLSNETEFLGAQNGWQEMTALDTNNDGKVSVDEMKDLMVVSKDAEGNQTVQKASDLFAATDTIDLNSYTSQNKDFENGNTLLGTFSLSFQGNEVTDAYNTMDEISWLDENYEFTDEANGINRFAKGNTTADDILDYSAEYATFQTKYEELDSKLTEGWQKLNITRTDVSEKLITGSQKSAENKASSLDDLFKKKVEEEQPTQE